MKNILTGLLTGFAMLSTAALASADTLDFTEFGAIGNTGTTIINLTNATLTSSGTHFFIYGADNFGEANSKGSICSVSVAECVADWQVEFLSDVSDLSFDSDGTHPGDSVEVYAYLDGAFLGSSVVSTNTHVDMSAFGAIDRLLFDDSSIGGGGLLFNDFNFNAVTVVPLPAAFPLYGAGLVILGFVGWRRKQRQATV